MAIEPLHRQSAFWCEPQQDPADPLDHVLDASPPAASVFKLITGSALLDQGLTPESNVCYHGGAAVT